MSFIHAMRLSDALPHKLLEEFASFGEDSEQPH